MTEMLNKALGQIGNSNNTFYKFISANDLGLTGGHQSGYYVSKEAAKILFDCDSPKGTNVEKNIHLIWGDGSETDSCFKYYGQGSRDESRITKFGRGFEYMRPQYLGSLLLISYLEENVYQCSVLDTEEDIEEITARYELPANSNCGMLKFIAATPVEKLNSYFIETIRPLLSFPSTYDMSAIARDGVAHAHKLLSSEGNADKALIQWIEAEYILFRLIEEKIYKPVYSTPFKDCQSMIDASNEILNRRKSRAGKSLEHHLARVFVDHSLEFEEQCITEDKKKPDFIFPNGEAYHNLIFPAEDLTFLGAKTTCKDRWRQVLNEADRIELKYLFTLQQGISSNQLKEMKHENLKLVVPKSNISCFAKSDRSALICLNDFIQIVREKQSHYPKSFLF